MTKSGYKFTGSSFTLILYVEGKRGQVIYRFQNFQSASTSSRNEEHLGGELTSAKHQLLEVREQLEMAEQELERKFSQTGAYQNMKKMLAQKNNQIKDLRRTLAK